MPVATCLSGGVDSGSITAVLSKLKYSFNDRFKNYTHRGFCASFPGTPIDESIEARNLGKELNTRCDIIDILPPNPDELEEAMKQCDGPMHALAFYPIWRLYRFIKENGITVTLDGQGPDEMLGGYRPLEECLQTAFQMRKFSWFCDVYRTYALQGESSQFSSKKFANKVLLHFIKNKFKDLVKQILIKTNLFKQKAYILPDFVRNPNDCFSYLDKSLLNQFFQAPLPGILHQYDRCSMAHGVECRMPFMDYRIVEFIFSLPFESKVGGGYTKRVLREAMAGVLPDYTRLNRRKIGFNAPIVDWFRGSLKEFMLKYMNKPEFIESPYFDGRKLKLDFEQFLKVKNPSWVEAWKFWPPVHLIWWMKYNKITIEKGKEDVSPNRSFCL